MTIDQKSSLSPGAHKILILPAVLTQQSIWDIAVEQELLLHLIKSTDTENFRIKIKTHKKWIDYTRAQINFMGRKFLWIV